MSDIEQNNKDYNENKNTKQPTITLSTLITVIIVLIVLFAIILACVVSNLKNQNSNMPLGEPEDFSVRNTCYRYR